MYRLTQAWIQKAVSINENCRFVRTNFRLNLVPLVLHRLRMDSLYGQRCRPMDRGLSYSLQLLPGPFRVPSKVALALTLLALLDSRLTLSAHVAALCRSGYCTSSDNFARSSNRWQWKVQEPQLWRLFPAGWITAIRCSTRHGTGSLGHLSARPGHRVIILTRCETRFFPVFEKKPKIKI